MVGMFAVSLQGHDKEKIYVIVKEDAEYVYLCDGKYRPLDKLKRKNQKHIQVIKNHPDVSFIKERIEQQKLCNEEVKRILKEYNSKF